VLRNTDEDPTARSERRVKFTQHRFVIIDVFERVERRDHVELPPKRQVARIGLKELDAVYILRDLRDAHVIDLGPPDLELRIRGTKGRQDDTNTSADLEEP